jgi:general secretion pathway protein G
MKRHGRPSDTLLRRARLLEVVVALVVIGVLLGAVLGRLEEYRRQMRVAVALQQLSAMRTAMLLKMTQLHAQGRSAEINNLVGANPITWLGAPPANYLGELSNPDEQDVPSGHWFYEKTTKTLVYVLNQRKTFPQITPKRMKFQVKLLPATERFSQSSISRSSSLVLEQVDG